MSSGLQPLLNDAVIVFRAPTQVWSRRTGDVGGAEIDGVYHGDVRHIRSLSWECAHSAAEWLSTAEHGASRAVFESVLRGLDDRLVADPRVRLRRERVVDDGVLVETCAVVSRVDHPISTTIALRLAPDFASLHDVKAGIAGESAAVIEVPTDDPRTATVRHGDRAFTVDAPGAEVVVDDGDLVITWPLRIAPRGRADTRCTITMHDASLVVRGTTSDPLSAPGAEAPDFRMRRWSDVALADLNALRLTIAGHPSDDFYAAGAPWFLTLFGRDSLWAARLALPADVGVAASTLRVLARLQGADDDPVTAQEPGKVLHELRASAVEIPGEAVTLPPLYYGSVDATPLWVCLLADAWRAGMPENEVRELVPALRAALRWIVEDGDSNGDGFLDYIDRTGRGLANQGWKDSGDSIQWRDGTLAAGPIALCEVQGYAYEAVSAAAEMLDSLSDAGGDPQSDRLRAWAAELKRRFAEAYWVSTPEGRYPAVALDRDGRPIDSLTSNIGHLLGTGILDPDDERHVADLLLGDTMSSGYGIRTMSTGAAGYWPLSYHGGSVWTHDTAIAARGMWLAGLGDRARAVVEQLLAAAEGFGFRVPELHSGDPAAESPVPVPYPAACRPQAWSSASAITCDAILRHGL